MDLSRLRHASAGFSLIEIAIVLVVIGILLSGGLLAVSPIVQQSKVTETKARIARVETAIQAYVIANGCLPCPADPALASTDSDAGVAQTGGAADVTPCASTCDVTRGVVPWRNLGISEADITDAYGTRLSYSATSSLCNSSASMTRVGGSYPLGDITVNDQSGGAITSVAAYVVVSHGPDGEGGNAVESGTVRTGGHASPTQAENSDADAAGSMIFNLLPANSIDGTGYFDDIVEFRTAPIVVQGCGAGSCGNPS